MELDRMMMNMDVQDIVWSHKTTRAEPAIETSQHHTEEEAALL